MLIYFCIPSKSHTKHILILTILIIKEIWNISSRISPSWRADLVLEVDVGLIKDTASHVRSGHSIHFILYMTMKQEGFEGQQNCTKWDKGPCLNGFYKVCVVRWDFTTVFMWWQTQSTYTEFILTSIDTCDLFRSRVYWGKPTAHWRHLLYDNHTFTHTLMSENQV